MCILLNLKITIVVSAAKKITIHFFIESFCSNEGLDGTIVNQVLRKVTSTFTLNINFHLKAKTFPWLNIIDVKCQWIIVPPIS